MPVYTVSWKGFIPPTYTFGETPTGDHVTFGCVLEPMWCHLCACVFSLIWLGLVTNPHAKEIAGAKMLVNHSVVVIKISSMTTVCVSRLICQLYYPSHISAIVWSH